VEVGGGVMFNLTRQEEQVIIFFSALALVGAGLNFLWKSKLPLAEKGRFAEKMVKINLNQASQEELVSTQAVSEKLARKIIAYRLSRGEFAKLEELKEVKGIGEYRYKKLKELFFVE
jgi:competence ComEA-like helix-hairpin-helix protein